MHISEAIRELSRKECQMLKRIVILALTAVCLVSAKTYTVNLNEPAQAGSVQLKPGHYTMKVTASQVVLVDKDGHPVDVTATVLPANRKFEYTSVVSTKEDGQNKIREIDLGGSSSRVVFQ